MRKSISVIAIFLALSLMLTGTAYAGFVIAGSEDAEETAISAVLEDGVYTARFDTDSSMFAVNEACEGRGILTVENGEMTIHVSLISKKILNLFPGTKENAEKEGAQLLEPTVDPVTYSDGYTEEVYGFDIPVPYLDDEFDLAIIGTKEKWYDHKVSVSDPVPVDESGAESDISDGEYLIELTFEGGSGKAFVSSPAVITVDNSEIIARIEWSSPNYDYMIVDEVKYLPVNEEGNSVFEIPVTGLDIPVEVTGDTTAMSVPHEIEYVLTFISDTIEPAE